MKKMWLTKFTYKGKEYLSYTPYVHGHKDRSLIDKSFANKFIPKKGLLDRYYFECNSGKINWGDEFKGLKFEDCGLVEVNN